MSIYFLLIIINICSIKKIISNKPQKIKNKKRILDASTDLDYSFINNEKIIIIGENGHTYSSNFVDENGQLFILSYKSNSKERYVYSLLNNGRVFFKDNPIHIYSFTDEITSNSGNTVTLNSNGEKYLLSVINGNNYFELLDLSSNNLNNNIYISNSLLIPNSLYIASYINSFFKLKTEENQYIFVFYNSYKRNNRNYYRRVFLKGTLSITSGNIVGDVSVEKAYDTQYFSNSISCLETTSCIICIYINYSGYMTISVYDKDLEQITRAVMENKVSSDDENNFKKGIFLRNETCAFMFFQNGDPKPILIITYLTYDSDNNEYKINFPIPNINSMYLNVPEESDNNCNLNDLIKIHDNRFSLLSTSSDKKRIIVYLFDLYNNDKNLKIRLYYMDLNGYNMNSNLRAFLFRNYIGFNFCYGEEDNCAFRILSYANTIDYEKQDDFLIKLDTVNPLNLWTNIEIENNIFDYVLIGVKILSIPDIEKTRLSIKTLNDFKEIKANDLLINDSIIFSYIANKTITNGDYLIEFAPIVSEKSYEEFNLKPNKVYTVGDDADQESEFTSLTFMGRYGHFPFNLQHHSDFKCHGNCDLCYKSYVSDNEQYCLKCKENYYYIEDTENCFYEPIGYYFNEEKNVYSSCHSLCAKCLSKEISNTNMNCLSCKDNENYKYYPKNKNCLNCPKFVNYDQTECIDEIPDKYYLYDSTLGTIEQCYSLCLKCSEGPTSTSMNCDYCIEGYYLKIDNEKNKNCFPNNEIVEANFFKDPEKNIFYECFNLCGTCDNFGNITNMNCLTCANELEYGYDELNKSCFLNITCNINSSFYYTLDENKLKAKICLDNGQFCPGFLPFELILTKECILSCSYEEMINYICKPSNMEEGIKIMKETFENEVGTNDGMIEDILKDKFDDVTVFGNNATYQITSTTNQEEKINNKIDDAISNIDLGECERIIKQENNIDENVSLIIIKDDLKRNETISTQVEYQVYDPISRKALNLSSCENTTIAISVPLDVDDKTLNLYKHASEQGYDIFDSESDFYNDVCTVYTSERGTDMILSDRRTDILNNTPSICESGCKYNGMNIETKKAICICSPKYFINTNTSEISFSLKFLEKVFFKPDSFNYKILGCSKLLSNKKNIIQNYGFYIMGFMLLLFFILIPINLTLGPYQLKLKCYKIIQDRQNIGEKKENNDDIKRISNSKEELHVMLSNSKLKKDGNSVNQIPRFTKKNTTKNMNKDNNLKMNTLSLRNNNLNINNNNKININININHDLNNIKNDNGNNINNNHLNIEINKKKLKKTKTMNNINLNNLQSPKLKSVRIKEKRNTLSKINPLNSLNNMDISKKNIDSISPMNSALFKRKNISINKINNDISNDKSNEMMMTKKKNIRIYKRKRKKKIKMNKEDIISEKPEDEEESKSGEINGLQYEKKKYFENFIKNFPAEERIKYFEEEELNQMDYYYAMQIDKREFNQYYFSLLKKKQLILFTFFSTDDFNIYLIKISLFICSFSVFFMSNTFFFNDSNMHEIYENNGRYNFIYDLPQIIYSALISAVVNIIMRTLSLSENGVIKIKQLVKINNMINQTFVMIKCFKTKIIFFNILGFILIFFAFYYVTMFCAVYKNTQIHLLKDLFTSFGLTLLYPFGLYLIPGFFRIPSLKSSNNNSLCLYKTSQLFSLI